MNARFWLRTLAIFAVFGSTAVSSATRTIPQVGVTARPSPPPLPYNESADAHADVASAIARARATKKHVFLDFGGNWCPDCRVLAAVLELEEVKSAVASTFEVAMIDIGRRDKNLDIAVKYGINVKAVPLVIVLDSDGAFLNAGNPTALSSAREMSNQAIVDTIFGWAGAAR